MFGQIIKSVYTTAAQVQIDEDLGPPQVAFTDSTLQSVLQIAFGVAAGIAVIMISIAAFNYVTSTGNPQATAKAKDTIIFALVGLVVSMAAFTIVTFVIGRV